MLSLINQPAAMAAITAQMEGSSVVSRLWAHDHRLWKDGPAEITNRLGWLHLPETMPSEIEDIAQFADEIRGEGFAHVLLLGMGGSSLAPETFARAFGAEEGFPDLHVLDSTHPDAIRRGIDSLDLQRTLVIVATKSGTTTETLSFFRYVHEQISHAVGDDVGSRFIAITDPGSSLVELAGKHGFRRVFENDPNLGGRYSALSHFGLVPAALIGVNLEVVLERTQHVSRACAQADLEQNPGALLGAFLGAAAHSTRDKVTFLLPDVIAGFGDWVEQLIAESTGKEGLGILPVVGETPGPLDSYGQDGLFVQVVVGEDVPFESVVREADRAGYPIARVTIEDVYDLGALFFLWEVATAVAGHTLGINPFDQPNVEAAKVLARQMIQDFETTGQVPPSREQPAEPETLRAFLESPPEGGYVALQAYAPSAPSTDRALGALRAAIRDATQMAVTVGYGPRFLHSTGQLHKGDAGHGRFIQLLVDSIQDLEIPGAVSDASSELTFGTLIAAQAAGDRRALLDAGRRVLTLRLDRNGVPEQLERLARGL